MGTCTIRYLGHRSFGSDCDHWGITAGWCNLETGALKNCYIKKECNAVESHYIPKYELKGVKGKTGMMQKVVILPFMTIMVKGAAPLMTHSKCVNVIIEPNVSYSDHVTTARSHSVLRPMVGKVDISLWNHSAKQLTFPNWTAVGEITATNAIPALVALKPTENEFDGVEATTKKKKQIEGQR